jgi:ABC-type sulfate transport system substrate-binding protein
MENTIIEKIDLTARALAYAERKKAEKRAKTVEYVENLLAELVKKADEGGRSATAIVPYEIEIGDVIKLMHERAVCTVSRVGVNHKIFISWL